jgi:hypothetical protein
MGVLKGHEAPDSAQVIAQMQIARRLDARKYAGSERHVQEPPNKSRVTAWFYTGGAGMGTV